MVFKIGFIKLTDDDFYESIEFPGEVEDYECEFMESTCVSLLKESIRKRYNSINNIDKDEYMKYCEVNEEEYNRELYFWNKIVEMIELHPSAIISIDTE
jgi:hypothetical protein